MNFFPINRGSVRAGDLVRTPSRGYVKLNDDATKDDVRIWVACFVPPGVDVWVGRQPLPADLEPLKDAR